MTNPSEIKDGDIGDLVSRAIEASLHDQKLRIVLWGGEVIEGDCTATSEDHSEAALPSATSQEEAELGPPKREITVGDRTIVVADIDVMEVVD